MICLPAIQVPISRPGRCRSSLHIMQFRSFIFLARDVQISGNHNLGWNYIRFPIVISKSLSAGCYRVGAAT